MSSLISNSSAAFASLSTYLGSYALHQPRSWPAPSLVEVGRDTFEINTIPVNSTRAPVSELHAGLTFWAAPKAGGLGPRKGVDPASLSEAAQLVTEIFGESLEQLHQAKSFEKLDEAWENLKDTFFMPADDLPEAQKKIEEWLGIFGRKMTELVGIRNGFFLKGFELYRRMIETVAEPKSVGRVVQRCLKGTTQSGWGKSLLENRAALEQFFQKSVDEKWEPKDRELLLSIWNEPVTDVGEVAIARATARAILSVEAVDINHLEAVRTAQTVFNLWNQRTTPETVGARFQLDAETRARLAPKMETLRQRNEAGESRWDRSWRADAGLPQTSDGFFTLNIYGQAVTLTVEGLALLSTPELDKRFADIRTTPENKPQVAWAYLKERLQESGPQEILLELLKNLQLAVLGKWFAEMSVTQKAAYHFIKLEEVEAILEDGFYHTARVGNEAVCLSSERLKGIGDETSLAFVRPSGFRRFSAQHKRTFQKKKLSEAERNYFVGLHELVSLGEGIVEILKGLDRFRWTLEPPAWVGIYEEIVVAVGEGTLPPSEGAMRLLRLRQNEAHDSMKELDFRQMDSMFREPVDPEVRAQLVSEVFSDDLLTMVFMGERLPSAAVLREILGTYINVALPRAGIDVSSLRLVAGDLLEFGRKASPHDDRYSAAEFRRLLLLHQMTFQEMKKFWNPVAVFKGGAAEDSKPFRNLSNLLAALLLNPQMPTHVDIAQIVKAKLRVKELSPALLKEDRARRAIEEACWVEVCVAVIKNFKKAVIGEAYDKDLFKALFDIFGEFGPLSPADRELLREKLLQGTRRIKIGEEEFLKPISLTELARLLKNFKGWVDLEDVLLPARLVGPENLSDADQYLHQIYNLLILLLSNFDMGKGIPSLDMASTVKAIAKKFGFAIPQ